MLIDKTNKWQNNNKIMILLNAALDCVSFKNVYAYFHNSQLYQVIFSGITRVKVGVILKFSFSFNLQIYHSF